MIDQKTLKRKVHPPEPPPTVTMGQVKAYTMTLGQINVARRRNALNMVRQLIREHSFTIKDIEGR